MKDKLLVIVLASVLASIAVADEPTCPEDGLYMSISSTTYKNDKLMDGKPARVMFVVNRADEKIIVHFDIDGDGLVNHTIPFDANFFDEGIIAKQYGFSVAFWKWKSTGKYTSSITLIEDGFVIIAEIITMPRFE